MNREEAIQKYGEEAVRSVESGNAEYESVMDFGMAMYSYEEEVADGVHLKAVYYQKSEDMNSVENMDDLKWKVDHFEEF